MTLISNFTDWSTFVAMGGYGLYVWGSFGMAAAVIAAELFALRIRRHALREPTGETLPFEFGAAPHEA